MDIRNRFNSLTLEEQIVFMICSLGFIRAVIAVVMDVTLEIHFTEIVVDSLLLVVLFVLAYLSLQQKIKRIGIAFGFLLSLLLAVNFIGKQQPIVDDYYQNNN